MKTGMLRKVEEAYIHSLPVKEHQVWRHWSRGSRRRTVSRWKSTASWRSISGEVDHARQRQLDCADRQLDHNRNSDLNPYFDSKPGVQTRCSWSGGTLSSSSCGLDYVKTSSHSASTLELSQGLTAWSGTLANRCSRTARR